MHWRPSRWAWAVAASVLVLAVACGAFALWWALTMGTRTASYSVPGAVERVELSVASGNVELQGGGSSVDVSRTDRYAFDRRPNERRGVRDGVLRIRATCPSIVLGSCSASYRVVVPDDVSVSIDARDGDVHLTAFSGSADLVTRGGKVTVEAFCGHALSAQSRTGDIDVTAACPPDGLTLRSRSGNVTAFVPSGRYRVDADSGSGNVSVRGRIVPAGDAPWHLVAVSQTGDVSVEGGP